MVRDWPGEHNNVVPTQEEKWRAEFDTLGPAEVRWRASVGGYEHAQREAALEWLREQKRRAENGREGWAIVISLIALAVSILSFIVALLK